MRRSSKPIALLFALFTLILATLAPAAPKPDERAEVRGTVTLPLTRFRALDDELHAPPKKARDAPFLWVKRRVEGRFRKGLWAGRLVAQFDVLSDEPVHVPVLVASGSTPESLPSLRAAHGVIVGTAIRKSLRAGDPVDAETARSYAASFRKVFA